MNKLTLEKALLAGVVVAMIVVKGTVLSGVEVEAKASKYGPVPVEPVQPRQMTEEEKEAAEERSSNDRARILAAEHEAGMANGTAGEALAPQIKGSSTRSNVKGCYNTRNFGGNFSVYDWSNPYGAGPREVLNRAVSLNAHEEHYASIMDSKCGDIAKSVLQATAAGYGYLPGPIVDINIGKKTESGEIVYPEFPNNGCVAVNYEIPSGWRLAGYEPAFICLLPDGSTELLANLSGGALGGIESGLIAVDHPQGVYMLTMVPEGSLSALHNQQLNKYLNFMWGL